MNQANETQQVATLVLACAFTLGVRVIKNSSLRPHGGENGSVNVQERISSELDMLPSKLRRNQTASSKVGR